MPKPPLKVPTQPTRAKAAKSGPGAPKPVPTKAVKPAAKPTVKPAAKPAAKPTVKPAAKPTVEPAAKPTVEPEARAHAALGPSGLKSREICPSYRPTPGDSAASLMGSKLHDLLERFGIDVASEREFMDLDSDEQHTALEKIADYVTPYEQQAKKIFRELRLDLTSWKITDCDFGTADLVIAFKGGVYHLMDYKFGRIEVDDPETNIQMWTYALGVFSRFSDCVEIHVHVLQPLRDEVGTHVFKREDIERMHLRASTIAARVAAQAGKKFNVVPSNCRWCSNKGHCEALHEIALHVKKHASLTIPNETVPLTKDAFNNADVILQYGAQVHDIADLMGQWSESMRRRISQLAYEGFEIQGKRLIINNGKTVVANSALAVKTLANELGRDELEIFRDIAQIQIGAVDRLSAEGAPKGAKDAEKKKVRELLRSKGALTVGAPSHYLVDAK